MKMKKKLKRILMITLTITMLSGAGMTVCAAPKTMPDGNLFDAEFYAAENPDVAAVLGTEEDALYQHYLLFGASEGRLPYADGTAGAQALIPAPASGRMPVTEKSLADANALHQYYKGLSPEQALYSDFAAQYIAGSILAEPEFFPTDLDKVQAASWIVAELSSQCTYGSDPQKYYRSPYGVFYAGVYTCAGSTRALGRVLDYMGYSWQHVGENQNRHQWCVLTMDGQIGYADGMGGIAGYGEMTNGMTTQDGMTIWFAE